MSPGYDFDPSTGEAANRPARAQVAPLRRFNYLAEACPACGSRRIWCSEDHVGSCLDCSAKVADFAKATTADEFDFVRHPIKGWLPGGEVAAGIAGRPTDPADDPLAQAFRKTIEDRKSIVDQGEQLRVAQIANSIRSTEAERDLKAEQQAAASVMRAAAAKKSERLLRKHLDSE